VFPKDFLWGAATSSYQVEGGIENCDWAQAAREGKVPVCGKAADHWNRYEEDFDIAKELGHNAYRLSIEWSRIEPTEGEFNEEAIEHYRKMLVALKERGITPVVTLWHWTRPLWVYERGGFEHSDTPEIFARYCGYVVERLSDLCEQFTTMNEPSVFSTHAHLYGCRPPFKRASIFGFKLGKDYGHKYATPDVSMRNLFVYMRVMGQLVEAHRLAYDEIKQVAPHVQVSIAKHVRYFGANWNPFNKLVASVAAYAQSGYFLHRVKDKLDVLGLNYYRSTYFGVDIEADMTDIGWKVTPGDIYSALKYVERFGKPIIIMEAGIADERDRDRASYIRKQVEGIERALREGVDVRGHMYWSLLDNYEWDDGFGMRFGLVEINYDTLERTIRPSAYVYRDLIRQYQGEAHP